MLDMGSVRHRLAEAMHECNVVLLGNVKVGKSALINRFISNKFSEAYKATSWEKVASSAMVANRRVKYTIWDTTGNHASFSSRARAYKEADVLLLCFKLTDPTSLFDLVNHWWPEVKSAAPDTPTILVGCQADLRGNRDVLASLSKQGRSPVSSDQALTFSNQLGSLTYVEASARTSARAAISAFEVAALASMGKLNPEVKANPHRASPTGTSETIGSRLGLNGSIPTRSVVSKSPLAPGNGLSPFNLNCVSPRAAGFGSSPRSTPSPRDSLGRASDDDDRLGWASNSLNSSRSASLSSKSVISLGSKTPKLARRASTGPRVQEKTMAIKCQRLTPDGTCEEIDVHVPVPIYETIRMYNDVGAVAGTPPSHGSVSIGRKLKNFFVRSEKGEKL